MTEWTDLIIERLNFLWNRGDTASQIAKALGGGFTRNAVIGKVHRLKLPRRKIVVTDFGLSGPPPSEMPKMRENKKNMTSQKPTLTQTSFYDVLMNDTCRYIMGDPKTSDAVYCGHSRCEVPKNGEMVKSSYCAHHHALCHRKTKLTKRCSP